MSDNQNQNSDLDLSLHFLPDWAKQGSNKNIYENFSGSEESERGRPKGPRKGGSDRRPRRPGGQQGRKPSDSNERGQGQRQDRERGNRGGRRPDRRQGGQRGPRREAEPLVELDVAFIADEAIANSLAEQIKLTARAYPLFSIAHMILEKPERYSVKLSTVKKKGSEEVEQKLFSCALDNTIWLTESDAVDYLLKKHLGTFYETVKTEAEPPKGTYTFVGQCGMSGVILGPPNYHDYQNQLRKLYNDRFSKKMPFDRFKSRVKIVRDEETVNKWLEEQSFVTTYNVLNSPESLVLNNWSEVLEHFNTNHKDNLINEVSSQTVGGKDASEYSCPTLRRLMRVRLQDQKRFPLKVVHLLSQQLSSKGLQFFKVNKTVTHVCVSRPHYLDLENTSVKSGIRQIIQFINEHPGCNRKQLIDNLSDSYTSDLEKATPAESKPQTEESPEQPKDQEAPANEGNQEGTSTETEASTAETEVKETPKEKSEPSPVQKAIIGDLHWLLYQGNVIEFASGILEVAKKPESKPSRKKEQKAEQKSQKQKESSESQGSTADGSPVKSDQSSTEESKQVENTPAPDSSDSSTEKSSEESPAETAPAPAQSAPPAGESNASTEEQSVTDGSPAKSEEAVAKPVVEENPENQPQTETSDTQDSSEAQTDETRQQADGEIPSAEADKQ